MLEHVPILEHMFVSLSRAMRPGGRVRIIELHPERIASGSSATFRDSNANVHFASVAHSVPMLCMALESVGFDVVRRDWLATDTMAAEVPGVATYRGLKLLLDLKLTRRVRDRRSSGGL